LMLCHTNKLRLKVNGWVRAELGHPPGELVVGDRLICLRNNWDADIVNGTTGVVSEVRRVGETRYDVCIALTGEDRD